MADPENSPHSYTTDFGEVLKKEYAAAWRRRPQEEQKQAGGKAATGELRPPALYGVTLSGGGIRSASFCLGALQALDQEKLVERIDYLSTVSGGGYTGASMIAAMRQNGGKFPFSTGTGSDIQDNEPVNHIRDNSRFLAPRGLYDLLISLAVILRGLIVNFLLVLSVLLPIATFMILVNPTRAHLERSIILDIVSYWFPQKWQQSGWFGAVAPYLADPFLLTKIVGILLIALLIAWALYRSFIESYAFERARRTVEPQSWGALWGRRLILSLIVAFVVELQPPIILWLIGLGSEVTPAGAGTFGAIITAIIAMTAAFRGTLVAWIQRALNSPTLGARLQSMLARSAIYIAGLALPLMIYAIFLVAVIWGIRDQREPIAQAYPFAPEILAVANPYVSLTLLAAIVIAFLGRAIIVHRQSSAPNRLMTFLMALGKKKFGWALPIGLLVFAAFLVISATATRNAVEDTTLNSADWTVLARYALASLLAAMVGWNFTENANGLHRLYRDRLNAAFRLGRPKAEPLRLSDLDDRSPYIIVNGTLNVRDGDTTEDENPAANPNMRRRTDPAKRGRNAEFFLFSRYFTGSEATGFANTEEMEEVEPQLDLATAAAISGAAVSSSMGRISIGLLGPTLALLNLRLGYWLTNPNYLQRWKEVLRSDSRLGGDPSKRQWDDILRLYLFAEAFGRMRADSSRIYITDGGHIDNIGLYQLLKRRCKFIVVIDGEADPAMNFGAFCDVQRFARIDEGVRIILDWRPIHDAALERAKDRTKQAPRDSDVHNQHFAIGRILYEKDGSETEEGVLIYVKATVTGDEADYVLDYERRYPLFPHESTSDQFFSEEQMEAYRALGFHAMTRALTSRSKVTPPRYGPRTDESVMDRMKRELKPAG